MSSKPDDGLSTHVLQPLGFAAKIGLATGITGFTGGGVYGFFRSAHPLPFAAAVGLSSGYYGASTIFMRGLFLDALPAADREKRSTKILATGLSGAVSGAVAGLWRKFRPLMAGRGLTAHRAESNLASCRDNRAVDLHMPDSIQRYIRSTECRAGHDTFS